MVTLTPSAARNLRRIPWSVVALSLLLLTVARSAHAGQNEPQTLEDNDVRMQWSWGRGLALTRLVNKRTGDDALKRDSAARLFVISTGRTQLDARDFDGRAAVDRDAGHPRLRWEGHSEGAGIDALLTVTLTGSGESLWSLELRNSGGSPITAKVAFPVLDGLQLGNDLAANRYFHGLNGGSMGDRPIDFRAMYGYALPVMDVYDARGGVFVCVQDTSNSHKVLDLVKRTSSSEPLKRFHDVAGTGRSHTDVLKSVGIGMAVQHLERSLAPGERLALPDATVAVHEGDWRSAMSFYRRWVRTWYRTHASRPEWFRRVFIHKALHEAHFHPSGAYTRGWLQPGDTMVDVNHWMTGRGDYRVRADWGGPGPLRDEIQAWRNRGVRASLYLEAVCVDREIPMGKAHGHDWSVLQNGKRATSEGDREWNFCAGATGWQDYLAETCERLVRETGCDSIYPDSVGLRYYLCEDPNHDHPAGSGWYGSVERLLKKLRAACDRAKPGTVLYLEYLSSDVNTQYLDGCYSPCVNASLEMRKQGLDLYPTGTNLFRFYVPDFKLIEIAPETREGIGLAFFNGNGIHGYLAQPEIRPYLETLASIYQEYADAFASASPIPFVPTLDKDLYCHAFPGNGRTLFTLFNASDKPLEGVLLKDLPGARAQFRELVRDGALTVARNAQTGAATLAFRIEPREVLCVLTRDP